MNVEDSTARAAFSIVAVSGSVFWNAAQVQYTNPWARNRTDWKVRTNPAIPARNLDSGRGRFCLTPTTVPTDCCGKSCVVTCASWSICYSSQENTNHFALGRLRQRLELECRASISQCCGSDTIQVAQSRLSFTSQLLKCSSSSLDNLSPRGAQENCALVVGEPF